MLGKRYDGGYCVMLPLLLVSISLSESGVTVERWCIPIHRIYTDFLNDVLPASIQ
jgi:hypothetical protein